MIRTSSKLLWILFTLAIISAGITFYRSIIHRSFDILEGASEYGSNNKVESALHDIDL